MTINRGTTVAALLHASTLEAVDARILLAHTLGWQRTELITRAHEALDPVHVNTFRKLVQRRHRGEPVAYLIGRREFFGLDFDITSDVLIPRPETELLVECALEAIRTKEAPCVLDLGTGSGIIAIAMAHQRPDAQIIATDLSPRALALAELNAQQVLYRRRSCGGGVRFIAGDWYRALSGLNLQFDLIVSNPPYVAVDDPHLWTGDVRFEPRHALVGGAQGLTAIKAVLSGVCPYLKRGGAVWLEHGYDQVDAVRAEFNAQGFLQVHSIRDFAGIERVSGGVH